MPTNGADLAFGNLSPNAFRPTNDNLTALTSVNSITFSGPGYTKTGALGGNAFALVGTITVDGGLGTETINNNLTLTPNIAAGSNNSVMQIFGASTLDLTGNIVASEPAVGPTSAVVETAKVTLLKTQGGTLQLDGANGGFTGAMAVSTSGGILAITNSSALGLGTSVAGAPTSGTTTINTGGQLQLIETAKPLSVSEQLIINGSGIINDGALLNEVGNNKWTGPVTMNTNSTIGANAGTILEISGQIGDTGSAESITKVGPGTIIFSHVGGDTYHGQTIINNGILEIEDPLSLGAGANALDQSQSGSPQAETIVNYNTVTGVAGTLELNFSTLGANDPNGLLQFPNQPYNAKTNPYVGFQVFNDLLVLNGPGFNPTAVNTSGFNSGVLGALYNQSGSNAWDGNVILGSPGTLPNTGDVTIGANANSNLTISGVISSASLLR